MRLKTICGLSHRVFQSGTRQSNAELNLPYQGDHSHFEVMSVVGDLHVAFQRIGLEVIGDHRQNTAFGPLSYVLTAGPLVFCMKDLSARRSWSGLAYPGERGVC